LFKDSIIEHLGSLYEVKTTDWIELTIEFSSNQNTNESIHTDGELSYYKEILDIVAVGVMIIFSNSIRVNAS
jgi:hypothetical protein